MRLLAVILCCLMLSGCQHGVSLPAADNAEAAETAVESIEEPAYKKFTDFDGDCMR